MARVVRPRRTRRTSPERGAPTSDKTVRLALEHGRDQATLVIRAQEKRQRAVRRAPRVPQGLLIRAFGFEALLHDAAEV